MCRVPVLVLIFIFVGLCSAQNEKRTLVLLDNVSVKETHSIFFQSLVDRGHKLTYKTSDDATLALSQYGVHLHDSLIVFAPSTSEFGGAINTKAILDFVDEGGNLLLAVNNKLGEAVQKLSTECGIELDEEGTTLIDHWNYDEKDTGKHNLVIVDPKNLLPVGIMVGEGHTAPFLYRGIGISNDAENPLLLSVLHASSSAYSYNPDSQMDSYPTAAGSTSQLISALQARNNARIVVSGSLDFFSDELMTASVKHAVTGATYAQSGNKGVSDALTRWVFQENGVLRFRNVSHRKLASSDSAGHKLGQLEVQTQLDSSDYTILDEVEYSIVLEELVDADPKGRLQKWQSYQGKDVQLQFVRIDPFVRLNMKQDSDGKYYLRFKLPDVYGVFKFLVDYNRAGFSHVYSSTQVSVRPLWHTQYERFIPAAYPYYVSAFSMMGGLLLFSLFFLHSRPSAGGKAKND